MATAEHDEDLDHAGDLPVVDPPEGEGQTSPVDVLDEHEDDEPDEGSAKRDTELEEAVDPAEREEIRKRRREERRNKNRRQKEREARLENENRALNDRLAQLEQGFSSLQNTAFGQQMAKVDQEIENAARAHQHFLQVEAAAITAHNGSAAAQARENAVMARERAQQFTLIKGNAIAAARQQQERPVVDPLVASKAGEFVKRHSWYRGREATDVDSMVLNTLDAAVKRDGFDPRTDTYWQELETRMGKHLAHRIEKSYDDRNGSSAQRSAQGRASPVAGSSSASSPGGQTSRLSPEQVQAIKDAGLWNDPAARAKAIKAYQNYARR